MHPDLHSTLRRPAALCARSAKDETVLRQMRSAINGRGGSRHVTWQLTSERSGTYPKPHKTSDDIRDQFSEMSIQAYE